MYTYVLAVFVVYGVLRFDVDAFHVLVVYFVLGFDFLCCTDGNPKARKTQRCARKPTTFKGKEPDYLDYNIKGRGFWDRMPYNAGAFYITGKRRRRHVDLPGVPSTREAYEKKRGER